MRRWWDENGIFVVVAGIWVSLAVFVWFTKNFNQTEFVFGYLCGSR